MMRFMLETFIEILVCVSIGLGFRDAVKNESNEEMTDTDDITDVITYLLLISIVIFLVTVTQFTLCQAN